MSRENQSQILAKPDDLEISRNLIGKDATFTAMAEELRKRCDSVLDPETDWHLDPQDRDSKWWQCRNGNKFLVNTTLDLSYAGRLFEDKRYLDCVQRIFTTFVEHDMIEHEGKWAFQSPVSMPEGWHGDLDAASAAEGLGFALDLLRPYCEENQGLSYAQYLEQLTRESIKINKSFFKHDPPLLINAKVISKVGEGIGASTLEPWGILNAEAHLAASKGAATEFLDECQCQDGLLLEGPMYGFGVMRPIAVLSSLLHQRGDEELWQHPAWDKCVEAYVSQLLPGGMINMINDSYEIFPCSWLLAVAKYRKNGLARWLFERIVDPTGERNWLGSTPWDVRPAWWYPKLSMSMLQFDPEVPACGPESRGLSKTRFFPTRGVFDIRDGWKEQDAYASLICAPDIRWTNRVHHQHAQADRGHFILNALGEKFFIDVGYGHETFDDTHKIISPGGMGEGHSVPEIDGRSQSQSTLAMGFTEVVTDGWAKFGRLEYSATYEDVALAYRSFAYVPDHEGRLLYLVIHDFLSITSTNGMRSLNYQAGWDTKVEILNREQADIVGARHGNRCRLFSSASMPGLLTQKQIDYFPKLTHPRLRYRFFDSGFNALTILAPYANGASAPQIERTEVEDSRGFAAKVTHRGITDTLVLNVVDRFSGYGYETDGQFALIRDSDHSKTIIVDGSYIKRDDDFILQKERKGTQLS